MGHQFKAMFRALPVLALCACTGGALAANPLGFAVAAAPSMFVLAVAEAESREGRTTQAEEPRQPPREAPAPEARRNTQVAAQAVPDTPPEERKVSLR